MFNIGASSGADSESSSGGSGFNTAGSFNVSAGQSQAKSTGTSTSTSSSSANDRIWEGQSPYLKDKYAEAQGLYREQQPALQQEAGFAGDYIKDVQGDALGQWQDQISGTGPSQYADEMRGVVAQDAGRAQEQMMRKMDARAAAGQMSGGARHGVAMGEGMRGINDAMLREQANIGFQAEEAAKGRQMQALGMSGDMANLGMRGYDPLSAQWSGLQNYNEIVGDPTKLTSSKSSSTSTSKNESAQDSTNLGFGGSMSYGDQWNIGSGETQGGSSFNFGVGMK